MVIVHDGGDFALYLGSEAYMLNAESQEAFAAVFKKHGCYVENCTGWYSAVYEINPKPRAPRKPKADTRPVVDVAKFRTDLFTAQAAASVAVKGMADGGTCCFDKPMVRIARTTAHEEAAAVIGLRLSDSYSSIYKGYTMIEGFAGGHAQGSPRTKGAEAFAAALKALGYETTVFYQMD